MTTLTSASTERPVAVLIGRVLRWLDGVPYTILAIPLRLAVATVFWNSAVTKLANWDTAVELFVEEYKVPLLPPELAAYMAVSIELTTPEVLVYPQAWPTHIQWAAMLFVLLCRGPGKLSLDHLVRMRFGAPAER